MINRFFIFANRRKEIYGDLDTFLFQHPDYHSNNSVFILMNTAQPLAFKAVSEFDRKWIFFRVLADTTISKFRKLTFRDITLLTRYHFEYYCSLPDDGNPNDIFKDQIQQLKIPCGQPYIHSVAFNSDHHDLVHRLKWNVKPWAKQKTLSSGLWVYLHLKEYYPTAHFTFIGFDANLSPKFHNPDIEAKYLLELFKSDNIESYRCIKA